MTIEAREINNLALCDPLRQRLVFPIRESYFPLGFALEVRTNDTRVLEAARRSFCGFGKQFEGKPVRVDLGVAGESDSLPENTIYRARGHLLSIVCDAANFAVVDLNEGSAFGWINEGVAQQTDWLRHRFLEAIVYSCLCQTRVTPVHASCIGRNGKCLLLCGRSGAGKTSLAYACARDGWDYLGDDAVYLMGEGPGQVLLGKPYSIRFDDTAVELFPELDGQPRTRDAQGCLRIEMDPRETGGITVSEQCAVGGVVFLDRREGAQALLSGVDPEEAGRRLLADLPVYEETTVARHRRSIEWLVGSAGCRQLTYSGFPQAIRELNLLLDGQS